LFFLYACGVLSSGQRIGACPPSAPRSPQAIKELRGVVVDEASAVVSKVKIKLQVPGGEEFRDIASTKTDPSGRFSFGAQPSGNYRLLFVARGFSPATIPVRYSKTGFKGIRLTLPIAASDSCPQDWDSRLKVEEMTGLEGR
jgi:hypothetical protein